jgi:glycosyltransferase involved in cell wall biosynthesis
MHLVFLEHPDWLGSFSMPRFAAMLREGMQARGHSAQSLTATSRVHRLTNGAPGGVRKWAGYVDQFVVFTRELKRFARHQPKDTLYVLTDHALGMWAPVVADLPHIVHCHDFLAINSARGRYPENRTGFTGRCYQSLIRRGMGKANAFISISEKTRADLHEALGRQPRFSAVVYNALREGYTRLNDSDSRARLAGVLTPADRHGFFLHVGGNQWYKNRPGVVRLYAQWLRNAEQQLPLWMVGQGPTAELQALADKLTPAGSVRFLPDLDDGQVRAAYSLATMLLYPSLEEGFGWPIAEAMSCGAAVLTTDAAPMTEVAGDAAIFHRRLRRGEEDVWARDGASLIHDYLACADEEKDAIRERGYQRASQFALTATMADYEKCYLEAIANA